MISKIMKIHRDFLMQDKLLEATKEAEKLLRDIGFRGDFELSEYGGRTELYFSTDGLLNVFQWHIGESEYTVRYDCTVYAGNDREYNADGVFPDTPLPLRSFYTALAQEGFCIKCDFEKQYDYDRVKIVQYAVFYFENEPFRLEIKTEWYRDLDDC